MITNPVSETRLVMHRNIALALVFALALANPSTAAPLGKVKPGSTPANAGAATASSGSAAGSGAASFVAAKRSVWLPRLTLASSSICRYLRAWRITAFGTPASAATCSP